MINRHEATLCLLWDKDMFLSEAMCEMSRNSLHGAWMASMDAGKKEWAENFAVLRDVATYVYIRWDFTDQKWRS